jgi:nitrite reductase/ring-hydroxylating ferredoxin subunit
MSNTYRRRTVLAGGAVVAGAALAGCEVKRTAEPPPSGTALGKTSDIPVGGGRVVPGSGVVVTQPESGTFKAFSASCTHRGCAITEVCDGSIICPCHLSKFAISDGSVADGPADQPLPEFKVNIVGDNISVA